jgi:hypothetical protein
MAEDQALAINPPDIKPVDISRPDTKVQDINLPGIKVAGIRTQFLLRGPAIRTAAGKALNYLCRKCSKVCLSNCSPECGIPT